MIILAVETSCDDTGIAILEIKNKKQKTEIKSNIVSSQVKLHAKYGGVFPSLAKREHQKNLPIILKKSLKEAGNPKIDVIAVTVGPGLDPCLWIGINFAIELAKKIKVPIIQVNHIEAHILINFLNNKSLFPAICLVVSGGHTQLILMKRIGKYQILGETRDDAAGECFDKIARILGLGYPGGPAIAAEAAKFQITNQKPKFQIKLPRPMIATKDYDFSFSGLKTAVLYLVKNLKAKKKLTKKIVQEICYESQQAIIDVLIRKTIKAARIYRVKSIILGGGVTANSELRKQFKEKIEREMPNIKIKYFIPNQEYSTDNAVMTALTASFYLKRKTKNWKKIAADANLKIDKKI